VLAFSRRVSKVAFVAVVAFLLDVKSAEHWFAKAGELIETISKIKNLILRLGARFCIPEFFAKFGPVIAVRFYVMALGWGIGV
jgi:hypothetical protein